MGAPIGNTNRQTHGLRARWLTLGKLPAGASYVRKLMGEMRRQLEQAVLDNDQPLGPYQAARVNTACRHEARALLARRYLEQGGDTLTLPQRMELLKTIGDASDARDKAIRDLGLESPPEGRDPWADLDAANDADETSHETENKTNAGEVLPADVADAMGDGPQAVAQGSTPASEETCKSTVPLTSPEN